MWQRKLDLHWLLFKESLSENGSCKKSSPYVEILGVVFILLGLPDSVVSLDLGKLIFIIILFFIFLVSYEDKILWW